MALRGCGAEADNGFPNSFRHARKQIMALRGCGAEADNGSPNSFRHARKQIMALRGCGAEADNGSQSPSGTPGSRSWPCADARQKQTMAGVIRSGQGRSRS